MSKILGGIGLVELLDLYQIHLQLGADKRDYKNVDNNLLFNILALNNKLLNQILELLNTKGKEKLTMMCNTLIQKASEEQIKGFTTKVMQRLKTYNKEMYDELQIELYKEMYGCHFNEWLLNKATSGMVNEDGTTGAHWTLEQTNQVARQYDIPFTKFNEYDWNYVMNAMYSDYYGAVSDDISAYVKLARKFIDDKDAPDGKALQYYLAMKY